MSSALPVSERLKGITIEPAPTLWGGMIERWRARPNPKPSEVGEFRRELGLPIDRPLIFTGHQAEFWHPGILAKYLAAEAAATKLGAHVGWVVVDQDTNAPADIRFARREKGGQLTARTWQALPGADVLIERHVPLCMIAAATPAPLPEGGKGGPLEQYLQRGLASVHGSLTAHAGATSVARQVAGAVGDSLRPLVTPAPLVFASEMSRTRLFSWVIDRMRAEPVRCAMIYNEAAAAHPEAGMAPLNLGDDPELPLWFIGTKPMQPRTRAGARQLADVPVTSFAPRALLMTAMLRMAGCDLFIHGLGGGIYDKVTERWIREWLGVELAPTAVATATLLLPFEADVITPEQIDRAEWLAHHAQHDPGLLGDADAEGEKQRLLQRIREMKRAKEDPSPAFAALHQLLERVRANHAERLAGIRNQSAEARSHRADASITHDRTWAFPLYPPEDLRHLKREIEERFG